MGGEYSNPPLAYVNDRSWGFSGGGARVVKMCHIHKSGHAIKLLIIQVLRTFDGRMDPFEHEHMES